MKTGKYFKQKVKQLKGFTLIETIIVMGILSIVCIAMYSVFSYGNQIFAKGGKQYDIQSNIRLISDYIVDKTRFATELSLVSAKDDEPKFSYLRLESNELSHYEWNGTGWDHRVVGEGLTTLNFTGSRIENKIFLNITAEGKDTIKNQVYTLNTENDLPNLSIKLQEITTDGENPVIIKYSNLLEFAYNGPIATPTSEPTPTPEPTPILEPTPTPVITLTPAPTPTTLIIKFLAPKNGYELVFNGAKIDAKGNPAREFVITGVEKNVSYTYSITSNFGDKTDVTRAFSSDETITIGDLTP